MNTKEKIAYLKNFKHSLKISKNSDIKYCANEIKDFIGLNILPPKPLYSGENHVF